MATIGPFHGDSNAIHDKLPETITVPDAFHVVKLWRAGPRLSPSPGAAGRSRPNPKGRGLVAEILTAFPIPEIFRLGWALRRWRAASLAYCDTNGNPNGPTEAINDAPRHSRNP